MKRNEKKGNGHRMRMMLMAVAMLLLMPLGAMGQAESVGLRAGGGQAASGDLEAVWNVGGRRVATSIGWLKEGRRVYQQGTVLMLGRKEMSGGYGMVYGGGCTVAWQTLTTGLGDRQLAFGLTAMVAVEYKIERLPVTVALDMRPQVMLMPAWSVSLWRVGVTVRYWL